MGLEVNNNIDERYNLEKSTAACDFILKAKAKIFLDISCCIYNRGVAGVRRLMEFQKETNYYDLYMNEETSRYVFRIMALKEIMNSPTKYGFEVNKKIGTN
jgi:hypothetical protein